MRRLILLAVFCLAQGFGATALVKTYANPLDVKVADPHIFREGGTYYLYGTGGPAHGREGVPVWMFSDLVHWTWRGYAWRMAENTWGQFWFWGPEVHRSALGYLMYFGCFRKIDGKNVGRICVAQADSPLGPFRELRAPMFDWPRGPSIDFNMLVEKDGSAWAFPTMVGGGENAIYAAPMNADHTALAATPLRVLGQSQAWEVQRIIEGAFVFKRGDLYYMLYSGNHFRNPDYAVGYATARRPEGPWTKYAGNPIIRRRGPLRGPGCAGLIDSPDGKELFAYYHLHLSPEGSVRQLALDRIAFAPGPEGSELLRFDGPTFQPVPLPSGAQGHPVGRTDRFTAPTLDRARWMIVDEDPAGWRYRKGELAIDLQKGDMQETRGDYRNLFLQYPPDGDFEVRTRLSFQPGEGGKAFLCLWQDHDNFLRLSITAKGLEISLEAAGVYTAQAAQPGFGTEVYLSIHKHGSLCAFFASPDGRRWTRIGKSAMAQFHNLRVGAGTAGAQGESRTSARFRSFDIMPVGRDSCLAK